MALAEKKISSVENSINQTAANSISEPVKPKSSSRNLLIVALMTGGLVGVALTYFVMNLTVVKTLENSVVFEKAQKASYITANELDFETLMPRINALEVSNAAKAEKETILLSTIKDLQDQLGQANKKVVAIQKSADKEIKAAKLAAIEALKE